MKIWWINAKHWINIDQRWSMDVYHQCFKIMNHRRSTLIWINIDHVWSNDRILEGQKNKVQYLQNHRSLILHWSTMILISLINVDQCCCKVCFQIKFVPLIKHMIMAMIMFDHRHAHSCMIEHWSSIWF